MTLDRTHRIWGAATGLLCLGAGILYWLYARSAPAGPRGGSWPGLAFGLAGTGLIVFAALLGIRRKHPTWRVGRAAAWMKGHIWLGLLTVPLIFFHAGFSFGGPLTITLMVLLLAVTLSGVVGLALQQVVPRMMTEQVPLETIYEEIPHVCEQLRAEADALVTAVCGDLGLLSDQASSSGNDQPSATVEKPRHRPSDGSEIPGDQHAPPRAPTPEEAAERKARHRAAKPVSTVKAVEGTGPLRDFYLSRARPYLSPQGKNDRDLSRREIARTLFERLKTLVPPALEETLADLNGICEERRQLYVQARLHRLLHGWLLVHAPLTMALLVLTVFHALWAIRY